MPNLLRQGLILLLLVTVHCGLIGCPESQPPPSPPLSPPPLPPPPDPVADVIAQLDWGAAAFAAPEKMQIRTTREVNFDVSPSIPVDQLEKDLRERIKDELSTYRFVMETKVKLSNRMGAHLSGAGFTITRNSPEEQVVLSGETTTWRWQIEPKDTGEQLLFLSLDARIEVDGQYSAYVVRTYSRKITVDVLAGDWIMHFIKSNWQWLWAVVLGPLILAVWQWLNRRRKPNKKSGSGIWLPGRYRQD